MNNDTRNGDANRDPLTDEPGSHPVGTGIGAVVGGFAGKGVAEAIDPTQESAYWSENFSSRDYVEKDASFVDYGPAYGVGVSARGRYPNRSFDDVQAQISTDWAANRGASRLSWERARPAARDAWDRLDRRD